jgi:IclR family mhp operon transcriptional activator
MRGLEVLRVLNEESYATASTISRRTGLPRPTVYRLLHTLDQAGYVRTAGRKDTFRLTSQVRTLSDGFDDEAWVTEIAAPVIEALGERIVWPTDIATLDGDAMVVRQTTNRRSPLAINRETAGFRPPILKSSLGLAYIAFCPEREREMILARLASSDRPDSKLARDSVYVGRLLADVRARGYGFREGGISPKTGSIAVPVMHGKRVIASINIHYILSALSMQQVVETYLPAMREAAEEIERGLANADSDLAETVS